jgi:uncharacterized protein (TIGR02646 family)
MIQISIPLPLTIADVEELRELQQLIDNKTAYDIRVSEAETMWNSKPSALFGRVRIALEVTCSGARRCSYCEDSLADEIEHIRPKSWFPNQTFEPQNFLFACGPCNSPKNNKYAVVNPSGKLTKAYRPRKGPVLPPPSGQEALLNPWFEDAADFFYLDLITTFEFKPRQGLNVVDGVRAKYTIEVLKLNKDPLVKARQEAFKDFAGRIAKYYLAVQDNEPLFILNQLRDEINKKQHITVWREMQKQYRMHNALNKLFSKVPGVENW